MLKHFIVHTHNQSIHVTDFDLNRALHVATKGPCKAKPQDIIAIEERSR